MGIDEGGGADPVLPEQRREPREQRGHLLGKRPRARQQRELRDAGRRRVHAERQAIDAAGERVRLEVQQDQGPQHLGIAHRRRQLQVARRRLARHEAARQVQHHGRQVQRGKPLGDRLADPREHERQRLEPFHRPLEVQRLLDGRLGLGRDERLQVLPAGQPLPHHAGLPQPLRQRPGGQPRQIAQRLQAPALKPVGHRRSRLRSGTAGARHIGPGRKPPQDAERDGRHRRAFAARRHHRDAGPRQRQQQGGRPRRRNADVGVQPAVRRRAPQFIADLRGRAEQPAKAADVERHHGALVDLHARRELPRQRLERRAGAAALARPRHVHRARRRLEEPRLTRRLEQTGEHGTSRCTTPTPDNHGGHREHGDKSETAVTRDDRTGFDRGRPERPGALSVAPRERTRSSFKRVHSRGATLGRLAPPRCGVATRSKPSADAPFLCALCVLCG